MKQKDIFLTGEGDAWFSRNRSAVKVVAPIDDPVVNAFVEISKHFAIKTALEIGCGSGHRSAAIQNAIGARVSGIDPSDDAITFAKSLGVDASVGVADCLPYADNQFDAVLFGFCLYLCDRDDLFKIASEADRVLKMSGWLVIFDFHSPHPVSKVYKHREGVLSFKMEYQNLFSWHPNYTLFYNKVFHHTSKVYSDDEDEWVALSILRKKSD